MIGIRADANEVIASGHIMRCMAIAAQLVKMGIKVKFYISDDYPVKLLERRGFEYFVLGNDWKDKHSEVPYLKDVLSKENISVLLVDSYEADNEYLHELRQSVKIVYIDDLCRFPCDVDVLVNYAVQDCDRIYEEFQWKQAKPQMLTGLSYTPLREEFAAINQAAAEQVSVPNDEEWNTSSDEKTCAEVSACVRKHHGTDVRNIMITTGGSDNFGLTAMIAQEIFKLGICETKVSAAGEDLGVHLHILEGAFFNENIKLELLDLERKCPNNITVHRNLHNIENVLKDCQLAVSAGGTTLLEICACRVCCVSFAISDNQKPLLEYLSKQDAVYAMPDLADVSGYNAKGLAQNVAKAVFELIGDFSRRTRFANKAGSVVDGRGARRIAQVLNF